ncbi:MAG: hypothetical protein JRJ35_18260 [Deltaproteobacteria bacterium]|nr:hypothetical protein [Deltaproteobacteria bacterium]MBW1925394.1 hypothetical protein [Deltaproteobacteria bacterium]MBW1951335.1 hypothetical protein [Deltaproteobacteria bacterium]MBW2009882.1 hypothetical protein [Deltaproteobacteria bacterium]RLB39702.1 MAG: hypothetical protein DRH20_03010 [Deltaproteobacteria bacterium]
MEPRVFEIKSLAVQNAIMLACLGVVVILLIRGAVRKSPRHVMVFSAWTLIILWFFNSPFFGFSAVTVSNRGIGVDYGILSFRNAVLPLTTTWRIETRLSGIKKTRRLYLLVLGDHESMKVGRGGLSLLKEVGGAIDRMKGRAPASG